MGYEGRLAKIGLLEEENPRIDPEFEEITEGEEESLKQKLRTRLRCFVRSGYDKRNII
jgi:type I restriction enzyme R subunit